MESASRSKYILPESGGSSESLSADGSNKVSGVEIDVGNDECRGNLTDWWSKWTSGSCPVEEDSPTLWFLYPFNLGKDR